MQMGEVYNVDDNNNNDNNDRQWTNIDQKSSLETLAYVKSVKMKSFIEYYIITLIKKVWIII